MISVKPFALGVLLALTAGCTYDLTLPDQPQRGSLRGQIDPGGFLPSMGGYDVTLVSETGLKLIQPTDPSGVFLFPDLAPGGYYVELKLPGFAGLVRPSIRILAGQQTDIGKLAPTWLPDTAAEGVVTGKVVIGDGTDATGGMVDFLLDGIALPLARAELAADGTFVQRVPPGNYRLKAFHPLYVTSIVENVGVAENAVQDLTASPIVLDLNPATLDGVVYLERDGQAPAPAQNAFVTLSGGHTTLTDLTGAFHLTGLPGGATQVRVVLAGFHDPNGSYPLTLTPGGTSVLDPVTLSLDRGAITGVVELADHSPIREVTVGLTGSAYAGVVQADPTTPWRGTFRIADVPVGTYEVKAVRPEYAPDRLSSVVVTSNGSTALSRTLVLTLLPGAITLDDRDATSAAGYTRTQAVTIDFTDFVSAASWRASEDPNLTGADFLPFDGNPQPFTLSPAEGEHVVYAQYLDALGTPSRVFSARIVLDSVGPTGSIVVEGRLADGTASTSYATTATGNPPVVSVLLTQQGATGVVVGNETLTSCPTAGYSPLTGTTLSKTLDGTASPRVVRVCLRDDAGNVAGPFADTIVFKPNAPASCTLTLWGTKADGTLLQTATARGTVVADVTGCSETPAEFFLTSDSVTCSASAALPWVAFDASSSFVLPPGDGSKTVTGCVRDAARNVASLAPRAIQLDTTAPVAYGVLIDNDAAYLDAADMALRGGRRGTVEGFASGATEWAISETTAFTAFTAFSPGVTRTHDFATDGDKRLYAVFRDDVGHQSSIVIDEIIVDTAGPAGGSIAVLSPTGNGRTNSTSVLVSATTPADATQIQLVQDLAGDGCSATDLNGVPVQGSATLYNQTVSSGDGVKRLCARWLDAAGNTSAAIASATVQLDMTSPGEPTIITGPQTFNPNRAAGGTTFPVDIDRVQAADHARWEVSSPKTGGWVTQVPVDGAATSTFTFTLATDTRAVAGVPNALKIREVDTAGNTSPEATVIITTDVVAPNGVVIKPTWVDNRSGSATVHWTESTHPDVVGYRVYYGTAAGNALATPPTGYYGSYATQGTSPIRYPPINRATLSGLPNGASTFVTVRAIDHAGNEGAAPTSAAKQVELQPNEISPNLVADIPLPGSGYAHRVVTFGDWAYVSQTTGCSPSTANIYGYHLAGLVSPLQRGTGADPTPPTVGVTLPLAGTSDCPAGYTGTDLIVHGDHLISAWAGQVQIFSLKNPANPTLVSTVDLTTVGGWQQQTLLYALAARGNLLFAGGYGATAGAYVTAIDLAPLSDGAAGTVTTANILGQVPGPGRVGGLTLTRDRLIAVSHGSGYTRTFSIADLLTTPRGLWNSSDEIPYASGDRAWPSSHASPIVSGNYLFRSGEYSFLTASLEGAWAGLNAWFTPVGEASYGGYGQYDVAGRHAFVTDPAGGLRILDISDPAAPMDVGFFRTEFTHFDLHVYGPYLLATGTDAKLRIFELATPGAIRTLSTTVTGGSKIDVAPGLVYTSTGTAHDLLAGAMPIALAPTDAPCTYDLTRFDDVTVGPNGSNLVLRNTRNVTDRDPATTPAAEVNVALSASRRVVATQGYGNYLVTLQIRVAPDTPGTFIEIFDGRPMADGLTPATLTSLATYQVSSDSNANLYGSLALHQGRALVTLDTLNSTSYTPPTTGVYLLDLRNAFDDAAGTTLGAGTLQGSVNLQFARQGVIRGRYAYITTRTQFVVVDVLEAMDEDPATTVPLTATRAAVTHDHANGVSVYGGYALVMPLNPTLYVAGIAADIKVIDVSSPMNPVTLGTLPHSQSGNGCGVRASAVLQGATGYVSSQVQVQVLELE